jgi:hypothetical protein
MGGMTKLAIRVGTYHDVDDRVQFKRGRFRLTIYSHRHMPITYEVREYHDIAEVRAFGLGGSTEHGAVADMKVMLEVMRDGIDVLDVVFGELEHKLRRLVA